MEKELSNKLPITLCVITHNSGSRIIDFVNKHKGIFSEVLVCVQDSTDDTLKNAEKVADHVVCRRKKGTCDPDSNWLFSLAKNQWIVYLGDDEYLSPDLKAKLKDLIKENVDLYWLNRRNLVDGVNIFDVLGNDMQPRLFKKGCVNFSDQIHTYPVVDKGAIVAFSPYEIVHERSLEQLKASNRARNKIASQQMINLQEGFISKVEALLAKVSNARK